MQSRWGTWVMIVIGEAVIQMLYQEVQQSVLRETYAFSILAIVLMFSLAMQYYDACQCEWYNHALTKSAIAGVSWIWLHVPMSMFLFGVGASLKVIIHSLQHDEDVPNYNVQVCIWYASFNN
jgi:low temperature requirement protein LtrA